MQVSECQEKNEVLELFGLKINDFALDSLNQIPKNAFIVTVNFESLLCSLEDPEFKKIINSADLVVADGIFICFLALILRGKVLKRVPGIDLAEKLIENSSKIALLGAHEEQIEILRKKFADKVVFAHHGYFSIAEEEKFLEKISAAAPEVFLVALGLPKQEKFIYRSRKTLENTVKIGVGGSFDIWSGKLKRAPKWLRDFHLEWFFRIIQEPSRAKRFLYNVNRFVYLLLK